MRIHTICIPEYLYMKDILRYRHIGFYIHIYVHTYIYIYTYIYAYIHKFGYFDIDIERNIALYLGIGVLA